MNAQRVYLSTTIPYVNARPHIGVALELVQADVLARYHRQAGDQVRFQTGTDDNSLKNVLGAEAEGISTAAFVDRNAAAFAALQGPLALSFDDFIRTGSDPRHRPAVERLWRACARLVGKGVLRFHAVYWPAILLSAGEPLPTDILVHDYLTLGGSKISKSRPAGTAGWSVAETADPVELVDRYGTDAVRWWLLREVARVGDTDFTVGRLAARANEDLANDLGNLVSRIVTLAHRYRQGTIPRRLPGEPSARLALDGHALGAARRRAPDRIAAALADFDFRTAVAAVWDIVEEANRYLERVQPWHLARAERDGDTVAGHLLDHALSLLLGTCSQLGRDLSPFLPALAARIRAACDDRDDRDDRCDRDRSSRRLPQARPVFPRIQRSDLRGLAADGRASVAGVRG